MDSHFWENKRVLVTGGAGFIGSHLSEKLLVLGSKVTILDNLSTGKLKNIEPFIKSLAFINGDCTNPEVAYAACKNQDVVMNLAARVGGIEYNRTHQGTMLNDNLQIGTVIIEAAKKAKVERFLVVSSACVYPHDAVVPTPESEGFHDEPEPTNLGYGWAKRMDEVLGKTYATEFGMKVAIVRPYNTYGPRDHIDPETSHVIPALIQRVMNGENPVLVWGTGKQTRAFLYVEDLVEGMILAIEKFTDATPVNLGTDEEVSIDALTNMVITLSGKSTSIKYDTSKPDGSPRRNSDNTLARQKLGFIAKTKLADGLRKTIAWYSDEKK